LRNPESRCGFGEDPDAWFLSHVEVEIQRKATAVGFDRVIPKIIVCEDLASILKGD
jgi:hypothetical protein